MQTSIAKTFNRLLITNKSLLSSKNGQAGFTIVEIMVALSLIVLIFAIVPVTSSDKDREYMKEGMESIDRAIRFSVNESILRNSIVRIKFNLETNPSEFVVEYGQSANLILPESKDLSKLSLKAREREIEKLKKLDSQFAKVDEFINESNKLPSGIRIYSVMTDYYTNPITEGEASLYFYPTGEKDSSLIILASEIEIASLDIPPFEERTYDEYFPFSESELANLEDSLENKAKEVFDKWLKN